MVTDLSQAYAKPNIKATIEISCTIVVHKIRKPVGLGSQNFS